MSALATCTVVASLVASPIAWPTAVGSRAAPGGESPKTAPQTDAVALADERHAEAVAAFSAGDLATAVAKFKAAYAAAPSPAYLFNIGRVYEEMGELASALEYYEQFARQPGLKLEERQQAAERIEVLRTLVPTTPVPPPVGNPPDTQDQPAEQEPQPAPDPVDPKAAKQARTFTIVGASLLGVGAAVGLGGGIGLGLLARNRSEQVASVEEGENPDGLTLSQLEDLDAEGRSFELWQIVTAASGGAMAITGAVLLGVGSKRRSNGATAGLRPTLHRNFAGATLSGRF